MHSGREDTPSTTVIFHLLPFSTQANMPERVSKQLYISVQRVNKVTEDHTTPVNYSLPTNDERCSCREELGTSLFSCV